MSRVSLGEFEHIVLAAILRLKPDAYGMTIRREILERTGQDASIGAVYTALDRLHAKGFCIFRMGEATKERGGRRKKYVDITAAGVGALEASVERLTSMWDGVPELKPAGAS